MCCFMMDERLSLTLAFLSFRDVVVALMMFAASAAACVGQQAEETSGLRRLFDSFGRLDTSAEKPKPLIPAEPTTDEKPVSSSSFLSRVNLPFLRRPGSAATAEGDPFAAYGAEAQRNLVQRLTPEEGITGFGNSFSTQPSTSSSPDTNSVRYPWPTPVDSQRRPGPPASRLTVAPSSPMPADVAGAPTSSPFASAQPNSLAPRNATLPTSPGSPRPLNTVAPSPATVSDRQLTNTRSSPTTTSGQQTSVSTPRNVAKPSSTTNTDFGDLDINTQIFAVVGDQSILAGDIYSQIAPLLAKHAGEIPPDQLEAQRELVVQQMLPNMVDNKLIYLDFLRSMGDRLPEIEKRVYKQFAESELPKAMEEAKVNTPQELDAKLRESGTSLDKQFRFFMERMLSQMMVGNNINRNREITHEQLLAYYREHESEYRYPARARWEKLTAQLSQHAERDECYRAVAEMGNEVLGGAPFSAVAKRSSQGIRASSGGQYDWTTEGSLVSEPLDDAIFSLPPGEMSKAIVDDEGWHIVRVIERHEAGMKPFAEAQLEISEKIRQSLLQDDIKRYVERLREGTYVWTILDDEGSENRVAAPLDRQPGVERR